jgi:hypothetical protein
VSAFDILKSGSFEVNVTDMSPRATSNEAVPAADESIASIIPLHQPKKAKTGADRARAYRQRKRQKANAAASPNSGSPSSESLILPNRPSRRLRPSRYAPSRVTKMLRHGSFPGSCCGPLPSLWRGLASS